jgi:hypothetical protein
MLRRTFVIGLLAALASSTVPLTAHEDFRIVGTVTLRKGNKLDVKTSQGRSVSMTMDANTRVTRDKKPVTVDELKAGLSVVINARGDTIDDLTVVDVRIVPTLTKR